MGDANEALNWAQAFERYINAENILGSTSWKEARDKIDRILDARTKRGDGNILYYDIADNTLWNEYKFMFLCQLVEFKTAELFYRLEKDGKIKPEAISELRTHKKADPDRSAAEDNGHILSPASLISDIGDTLGNLINRLNQSSCDFENKDKLLSLLNEFNKYRVSFTHHSFSTKKKTGSINLREVVIVGTKLGKEVLNYLN
jgi:hypothetical protein